MPANKLRGLLPRLMSLLVGLLSATACAPSSSATPITAIPTVSPTARSPVVTATQLASPTPVPTPRPPDRYFTDDFESGAHYWQVHVSSGLDAPRMDVEGGFLLLDLAESNVWAYSIFAPRTYDAVRVDALFELRGPAGGFAGVVCRYSMEEGWYEFGLSPDGTYSVLFGEWIAPEVARYTPIVYDESEYIDRRSSSAEIGLGCEGQTLWLYINGKLIRKLDVSRFNLSEGKIGILGASFERAPLTVSFDWVRVGEP